MTIFVSIGGTYFWQTILVFDYVRTRRRQNHSIWILKCAGYLVIYIIKLNVFFSSFVTCRIIDERITVAFRATLLSSPVLMESNFFCHAFHLLLQEEKNFVSIKKYVHSSSKPFIGNASWFTVIPFHHSLVNDFCAPIISKKIINNMNQIGLSGDVKNFISLFDFHCQDYTEQTRKKMK